MPRLYGWTEQALEGHKRIDRRTTPRFNAEEITDAAQRNFQVVTATSTTRNTNTGYYPGSVIWRPGGTKPDPDLTVAGAWIDARGPVPVLGRPYLGVMNGYHDNSPVFLTFAEELIAAQITDSAQDANSRWMHAWTQVMPGTQRGSWTAVTNGLKGECTGSKPAYPAYDPNNRNFDDNQYVWLTRGKSNDLSAAVSITKTATGNGTSINTAWSAYVPAANAGGQFTFKFFDPPTGSGVPTSALAWDAASGTVSAALNAIATPTITVSGAGTLASPWVITVTSTFDDYDLTADNSNLSDDVSDYRIVGDIDTNDALTWPDPHVDWLDSGEPGASYYLGYNDEDENYGDEVLCGFGNTGEKHWRAGTPVPLLHLHGYPGTWANGEIAFVGTILGSGANHCPQWLNLNDAVASLGAQGPQGPQGDVGPEGPQGPQGDQGPAGTKEANVLIPEDDRIVALFCTESPEVRFEDFAVVPMKGERHRAVQIDNTFTLTCEMGSIRAVGFVPSQPAMVSATVKGNVLIIDTDRVVEEVTVHLSGIRRGHAGKRFPARTREEMERNNAFWSQAHGPQGRG